LGARVANVTDRHPTKTGKKHVYYTHSMQLKLASYNIKPQAIRHAEA